jgi:hypothetical protein
MDRRTRNYVVGGLIAGAVGLAGLVGGTIYVAYSKLENVRARERIVKEEVRRYEEERTNRITAMVFARKEKEIERVWQAQAEVSDTLKANENKSDILEARFVKWKDLNNSKRIIM